MMMRKAAHGTDITMHASKSLLMPPGILYHFLADSGWWRIKRAFMPIYLVIRNAVLLYRVHF